MRLFASLITSFFVIVAIFHTTQTLAATAHKNPAVLPEGAKVVAGDLSKNEFFIVPRDSLIPVVKKSDVAKMKLALDESLLKAEHKQAMSSKPAKKVATNKSNKPSTQELASHSRVHRVVAASASTHSKKKIALAKTKKQA